ncbi:MAG TPA: valine--tRNA ligase [Methanothermobacter sp.]|uniref:Valine--tRNA ligase n=1 Tax=Methanothermobacter tenebrarum TaxID=680118 RepID=A0ABN6PAS2_9EURY|nr:valine--tRNA ligase [Methanothermobacter tenebrarum]MDD3454085.1 valine--tRNA ligase [Methanobacteriales archaeon]MDI6881707.1 valine--tRNA ligase [Methanothermobacter sp.]BDH79320.1 valine--tRNA ligase [Methanothermobacter tenebrarum]HHW16157.1 valine--tRNA ligase [Methanothermobacter sp.]
MDSEIPKDYDHRKETEWQSKWEEQGLYKFEGDETRPQYIIDTPPPYPTGSIHMGHVLNWVYMDIIARFKRMRGYDVLFPQGWDCHGLPTEVKVEETYNIKKSDITREEFRELCIELTTENIKKMKEQMKRLGFSQDWSTEFVTMTPEYMKKTQLSFLRMYKDGLIYRGVHPVNWCPRCETAIAFAEVEYIENETNLNYLKFPLEDSGHLEIATTRPELLAACVAVAVHPEDERYRGLKGKTVRVPIFNHKVKIIEDKDVDPEFGTGAVMICTFGDKTDVTWVNRHKLDIIEAIDEKGQMTEAAGKYKGLTIKECKEKIIEDLEAEGHLIKKERIKQNLGVCWRCKTPIEILIKKQWFVAVKKLIDDVIEAAEEMKWIPEHMKMRLLNWTGSMDWDWCISRQRVFATPIPVWYCENCGKVHLPTEEMLPVDPTQTSPDFQCECGSREFTGEEDVLDTWMDSSISPLALAGWPDPEYKKLFPSNLRPQGHDIIRTWAFYTILRCKALTGQKPFEEIIINGMVFGEDGHKMSKSRGNVITPEEVLKDYGADALRLWASNSVPGSDVPFAWKDVKYAYKFLRKFWNAFRFISFHLEDVKEKPKPLDLWILSKLNRLIKEVTEALEDYNFAKAINSIQMFIWHQFCDEYIEAVKYRLYSDDDPKSKKAAQWTLKKVLETSLRLLAPMAPHFTEEVHQHIAQDSIHKKSWPSVQREYINEEAEANGDLVIEIIGALRRFKSSNRIPLNAPLEKVNIYTRENLHRIIKDYLEDIKGTMNIQKLELITGKPKIKERIIEVKPVMEKIGPKFRADAPLILSSIESADPEEIYEKLETEGMIEVEGHKLTREYLKIKKEVRGATGEKVEVLHLDDIILEIIK